MTEPSDYERALITLIEAWKNEPPGIVGQALNTVIGPISEIVGKIIPPSMIEAVINAADWAADQTIASDIPPQPEDATIEQLDADADSVINWAIGYAFAEGTAAGVVGFASLPADIPALITLSLRTIRRVGVSYGYGGSGEDEKRFVLSVLSAAGANSVSEKIASITALRSIQNTLAKNTWKKIAEKASESILSKEAVIIFIRDLAKQLGINLTKRKALAAIPFIGAAVGGSMNSWYLRDVGNAAQRSYQERWLRDHDRWIDAPPTPPATA